jgi:hypothetical protein
LSRPLFIVFLELTRPKRGCNPVVVFSLLNFIRTGPSASQYRSSSQQNDAFGLLYPQHPSAKTCRC